MGANKVVMDNNKEDMDNLLIILMEDNKVDMDNLQLILTEDNKEVMDNQVQLCNLLMLMLGTTNTINKFNNKNYKNFKLGLRVLMLIEVDLLQHMNYKKLLLVVFH